MNTEIGPADVLLVDDDAVQGATRKAILERAGHTVAVAMDGREALELLESQKGFSVRVIITDHLMPAMNGVQFVRALREAGYLLPVLVLSGYSDVEEEYASLDVAFRVKPFPPDQLVSFIRYLVQSSERRTA